LKEALKENKVARNQQMSEEARDEIYFESYGKIEIHKEMCSDLRRIEAY
jgi:hypothetical protein